jgi:hypothetical protein
LKDQAKFIEMAAKHFALLTDVVKLTTVAVADLTDEQLAIGTMEAGRKLLKQ